MRLLRSFPLLAFALVLLSIVGLCVAQRSVGLLLVAGALAATSWYVTEGPRGKSLPRWVSNLLVLAVSLNVVVDLVQHREEFLGVLGRFTVWLTLIKLYERRTPRDYAHLLVLSLLLMLTAALQTSDFLFGAILLVYALLGLYVLLLFQLHAAHEQSKASRLATIPAGYRLVPPAKPVIGRHVGWQFRTFAVALGLGGFIASAIFFVAFPRGWGQGVVSTLGAPVSGQRTGFTAEVNLLGSSRITPSRAKVMDLQLLDEQGRAFRHVQPLLLRGAVLNRYESGRWEHGGRRDHVALLDPASNLLGDLEPARGTLTVDVHLHTNAAALFAPLAPIAVAADDVDQLDYDRDTQLLSVPVGSGRLRHYTVRFDPAPTDEILDVLCEGRSTRFRTRGRYVNDAVFALARRLLDEANLPRPSRNAPPEDYWSWSRDAAARFTAYLQSDLFLYTLDTSDVVLDPNMDPVAQFLLQTRRGHCEYFASALTALCHSVGIQARLVTGFVAYEYDEETQLYNVLESNAHAWVEARTGPSRWTTFDPTPPATLRQLHAGEASFSDHLRWIYQRLEGGWSSSIVEFDSRAQADLAARLDRGWSERLSGALDATRDWMRRVNRAFYFGPAGYIWMGIVAFALLIAVVALVKLMRRSRRIRNVLRLQHVGGREYQRLLRQLGFYLDLLRTLERGGCGKPAWVPPRQFAEELAGQRPVVAGTVQEVTDLFYAARYGGRTLGSAEMARARTLVDRLARELKDRQ